MPTITIDCPYCGGAIDLDAEMAHVDCPACGRQVSATAQLAFARARELFGEGQEAGLVAVPRSIRSSPDQPGQESAIRAYQRACSGLRLAFRDTLPEAKRISSLEMMAEMAQVLARRGRFPALEAGYWVDVLVEQNSLAELAELTRRLRRETSRGPVALLRRARMRLRRRQLAGALRRLARRIEDAEEALNLAEEFHARRKERRPG